MPWPFIEYRMNQKNELWTLWNLFVHALLTSESQMNSEYVRWQTAAHNGESMQLPFYTSMQDDDHDMPISIKLSLHVRRQYRIASTTPLPRKNVCSVCIAPYERYVLNGTIRFPSLCWQWERVRVQINKSTEQRIGIYLIKSKFAFSFVDAAPSMSNQY